jgi:uncharacterized protein (DUF4415 family)
MRAKKKSDEIYLDVTEEKYRAMQAKGIDEEALLKPGPDKFMRGLFKTKMYPYEPKQTKVRISIYLDADVLAYFRDRAAQPNAAPYQTQINNELRAIMEPQVAKPVSVQTETQINNELGAIMEPQVAKSVSVQTETQINNELRAIMEREATANPSGRSPAKSVTSSSEAAVDYSTLLDDPKFIAAVAERVRQAPQSRKPRRKPA